VDAARALASRLVQAGLYEDAARIDRLACELGEAGRSLGTAAANTWAALRAAKPGA
jgi:hypothetical protein